MHTNKRAAGPGPAAIALLLAALALAMLLPGAEGRAAEGYDLSWYTVDGGGGQSRSGEYVLHGTAGQPEAAAVLTGGEYSLVGGFWSGTTPLYPLYLPLLLR